ncbi:hypothetical protein Vretimale_5807 [Volvox reticuliferus]|uniref:CRAL-TRIO domain-containing protein n=1 Tax=Volvox reticuliferus TaxID=1737510 RepID=A0A8J4LLG3_9CHLO|nr:hypothetical protein Vretimale_5807 [Volvox reticuliferus]
MALSSSGFPLACRGLSAEQEAKIYAFKRLLQQSGAWDDKCFDEHDCARFLKARNYDFQAAKQMWDGMLAWRRENRVETIHDWFVFHERKDYDRVFPTGLHKTDKEGHPVLIQQLGRVNIGALYKVTTDDRIRLAHIAENEHLRRVVFPACSRAAGRAIDQLFTIIDLEGVAFTSMMRTTSLLKMFMTMDSNNYPETLAHMAIINAPGWFSTSWGAVKSVLSGDTVRKIEGPWREEELLPEPAAQPPPSSVASATAAKLQIAGRAGAMSVAVASVLVEASSGTNADTMERTSGGIISGGADQRTQRDVLTRRSQSPVRPGAKAGTVAAGPGPGRPAPPASPPLAKRPHHEDLQMQVLQSQQQQLAGPRLMMQPQVGPGVGSPAPSVSDSASDSTHNMTAPLMSNFLSSSESPSPQQQQQRHQQLAQQRHQLQVPLARISPQASAGGAPVAAAVTAVTPVALPRHSSGGGASGLVAGFVATLQAAVGHGNGHNPPQPLAVAADVGIQRPPSGPSAHYLSHGGATGPQTPLQQQQQQLGLVRGGTAGPAQLLLSSPREDNTGPGTMLSVVSAVYSPPSLMSPLSPMDLQGMTDTAISRRTEGGNGSSLLGAGASSLGPPGGVVGVSRRSGGGTSIGGIPVVGARMSSFTGSGVTAGSNISAFASAVMPSGDLLPGTAATAAAATSGPFTQQLSQQQLSSQSQQQQQPNDMDDAESVRVSVMSQRSFYSALSHLDQSSCSGITSPNEGSEKARRWSIQRELHAAAIASAVAATAERRAAVAAGATTAAAGAGSTAAVGILAKASVSGAAPSGPTVGIPPASMLSGVSYIVPPAAQQAFGSYLDQPPPYNALRAADGSGSFTNGDEPAAVREPSEASVGDGGTLGHGREAGSSGTAERHSRGATQTVEAITIHVDNGSNGGVSGGGMSRSPSAAAMEDCSLGAGAVRWARGWFFRRRNYGRLVESDSAGDGTGVGSGQGLDGSRQGSTMLLTRGKGGNTGVGAYATMHDGPGTTSPSKIMPKMPPGPHHARGDSWEWDQPSPYDIDQAYGRGGGSSAMHRDMSFGRGSERRRLLRSESPGRRRDLGDLCGCLPCCTIM